MPLTCLFCPKVLRSHFILNRHLRRHIGEKPCFCTKCSTEFSNLADERKHGCGGPSGKRWDKTKGRTNQRRRRRKCPRCSKSFFSPSDMHAHVRRVHEREKSLKCDFCGARFFSRPELRNHTCIHTGSNNKRTGGEKCGICDKQFSTKGSLQRHVQTVHERKQTFSCGICNKSFFRFGILKQHQAVHTGDKPFPCEICGKSFSNKGNLICHTRGHTGERPFTCSICGKGFTSSTHRSLHLERTHQKHESSSVLCKCLTCGKVFSNMPYLNNHIWRIHREGGQVKKHKCTLCSKGFTTPTYLKAHLRVHSGDKPFKCPDPACRKHFNKKGNADQHYRNVHIGNSSSWECVFCGKREQSKNRLADHFRRHHILEKPYFCNVCGFEVASGGERIQHLRVHTGEKPYSCKYCKKSFSRKDNLAGHVKSHHPE